MNRLSSAVPGHRPPPDALENRFFSAGAGRDKIGILAQGEGGSPGYRRPGSGCEARSVLPSGSDGRESIQGISGGILACAPVRSCDLPGDSFADEMRLGGL